MRAKTQIHVPCPFPLYFPSVKHVPFTVRRRRRWTQGEAVRRAEGHAGALPRRVANTPVLARFARALGKSRHGEHTPGRGYGATPASRAAAAS